MDSNQAPAEPPAASDKVVMLHGDLDIRIIEARRLPNMDMFSEHLRRCFAPCVTPVTHACCSGGTTAETTTTTRSPTSGAPGDRGHHHRPKGITTDAYVTVCLSGATVARTSVISNSQEPFWDERFIVPVAHPVAAVEFAVKDNDVFGAQHIGSTSISASRLLTGEDFDGWLQLLNANGKEPKRGASIHVEVKFRPVEDDPTSAYGLAGDPEKKGVRNAYFPLRKGGHVTLYQDAHVNPGDLPEIELPGDKHGGVLFQHQRCWEDICHAMLDAHHLIYLVGWSIYDKVRLVREPTKPLPDAGLLTLGDLLKYKSQEGVRVCILAWDDKTSHDKLLLKTAGVMLTHDEETRKFFKHSSVICVLSPRYASTKLSFFKQQVVGTLFTHHQKCVLVDTQGPGNTRKITAFVGGLDLCDGRYDTPEHRLFRDLDTVYQNDFHNPSIGTETRGPRQPWHDLHCKIEGPAAYDVLKNFEQRWLKASRWWRFGGFSKVSHVDDALIKLERISWILSPSSTVPEDDPRLSVTNEHDRETWHVQIFRSIDSGSVKGFPKDVKVALEKNLVCGKNLVIDKSIHTAYVKAIRSARHFIYIENQYFLGSSFGWPSYNNSGADNLIPMELALKIASKIRSKERFAVYVVIPMWPEGNPTENSVQEILFWQGQTVQMMYDIIAKELTSCGLEDSHPHDYLNFYCLGNREELPKDMEQTTDQNSTKTPAALARKFRRFMIYVHAKGMIVDDEYVIIGSANINQRSLDGSRDTEIAMGAYQPHHTWAENRYHPQGQIYGYRTSLWAEHLGEVDDLFKNPQSLECVKAVNHIAENNWTRFAAEETTSLQGHLLKYPFKVEADGKVGPLPGQECFPDFGGKILGAPTNLPDALTM